MKTDQETQKVLSDGERIKATMDSPGWELIERRFFEYLNALDSVQNIEETDPAKVAEIILVNQKVYKTLELFWADIAGDAEMALDNAEALADEDDGRHIKYQE